MKNIRVSLVLLSSIALVLPTAVKADRSEYSVGNSPLKLVNRSDGGEEGYFARFVGTVRLTGTLVVEFDRLPDMTENRDTEGEAFFLPDESSRLELPAAIGTFYPRPINFISLDKKPRALLLPLLGRGKTDGLLNGSMARYELPAEITIKSFTSWVECDHRGYTAEVASIKPLRPDLVAGINPSLIGC
ncbi:hypothetical protein [Roseateles albus]|uniref:Uncharacterized protein n=1 Tax=Roseateles albus TaxID=2987525 RepID=A0ABT5KCM8_9BURK|nr:hypothetical protein [Roseateles albus]MDC8770536.1 hypothetical protein [Roseateles albus]